eukprot:986224-Prymnesium_polylepis.1
MRKRRKGVHVAKGEFSPSVYSRARYHRFVTATASEPESEFVSESSNQEIQSYPVHLRDVRITK